jgi:hypothetical protein
VKPVWAAQLLCLLSLAGCEQQTPSVSAVEHLTPMADCELANGCTVLAAEARIEVRFVNPPRALQPFGIELQLQGAENVETATVTFVMRGMDMGSGRYRLLPGAAGRWYADATLPVCVSGRSDWMAEFELSLPALRLQFALPFVLSK